MIELFQIFLDKVYAKDESVELKTDRARFTKDDEQRDLDEKTEVVDAYRYGSTYVPIDDADSVKLQAEKCFDLLGFTKSDNVKRHYLLSEGVQQIMPDPASGEEVHEAFTNMVHAMFSEDVYGIVRRVFSCRSSPELACLMPFISQDTTCLLYLALPFEDDVRKFSMENFRAQRKFQPSPKQLQLVDELIEGMDLAGVGEEEDDEEAGELYDPHTTFNPFIQRMFQSIAFRATNPGEDLPDLDRHITSEQLVNLGRRVRNETNLGTLKRLGSEFPTRLSVSKKTKANDSNIFERQKSTANESGYNSLFELK